MVLRLSFPFYIPGLIFKSVTARIDKNPLHDGVRNLSGIKKVACSGDMLF